jgi:hypothetical protein
MQLENMCKSLIDNPELSQEAICCLIAYYLCYDSALCKICNIKCIPEDCGKTKVYNLIKNLTGYTVEEILKSNE